LGIARFRIARGIVVAVLAGRLVVFTKRAAREFARTKAAKELIAPSTKKLLRSRYWQAPILFFEAAHQRERVRPWRNCVKPQIAIRPATTRATRDTFMDMSYGPITTGHRLISLTTCMTDTMAKIRAETAA